MTVEFMDVMVNWFKVIMYSDNYNPIDHSHVGDEEGLWENEKVFKMHSRKLAAEHPLQDLRGESNYHGKKGIKAESPMLLDASTINSRRGFSLTRVIHSMTNAHADIWIIDFNTLT